MDGFDLWDDLERAVITEIVTMRLKGEDLFYTMTCQSSGDPDDQVNNPACGQRFKFMKHTGGDVLCPKCGRYQDASQPGINEAVRAIPVD